MKNFQHVHSKHSKQHHLRVVADNGETIVTSETFDSSDSVVDNAVSLIQVCTGLDRDYAYDIYEASSETIEE